jgi:hypothetical protein
MKGGLLSSDLLHWCGNVIKSIATKWSARADSIALSLPKGTRDLYGVEIQLTNTLNNLHADRGWRSTQKYV